MTTQGEQSPQKRGGLLGVLRLLRPGGGSETPGAQKTAGPDDDAALGARPVVVQRRSDAEIMRAARRLWCRPMEPQDVVALVLGGLDDDTLTATVPAPSPAPERKNSTSSTTSSKKAKNGNKKKDKKVPSTNPFDDDDEDDENEGEEDSNEEEESQGRGRSTNPFEEVEESAGASESRGRTSTSSWSGAGRASVDAEAPVREAARVVPRAGFVVGATRVDLDAVWLENAVWEAERALALFADELSRRVKSSHDEFVDGMRLVHDVGGEIAQSTALCRTGRGRVRAAKAALTATALRVAAADRRRRRAADVQALLAALRAVTRCVADLDARMGSCAYSDAIDTFFAARAQADRLLALPANTTGGGDDNSGDGTKKGTSKTSSSSNNKKGGKQQREQQQQPALKCTAGLAAARESATRVLERRLEASLRETAQHFDAAQYATVLAAYTRLGRAHEVLNRLDAVFVAELRERVERIVLLFMGARASAALLRAQEGAAPARAHAGRLDLARACAAVPDDQYIACLRNVLALCVDVMWNFLAVRRWHAEHPDATGAAGASAAGAAGGAVDTAAGLARIHARVWDAMQTLVATLVRCAVLARFPGEDALRIVEALNTFVEIGHEFCTMGARGASASSSSSSSPAGGAQRGGRAGAETLEATVQERCSAYFADLQRSMWEDLSTMYEKEQWQCVPVVMRLTDLAEFRDISAVTAAAAAAGGNGTTQRSFFAAPPGTNPFLDAAVTGAAGAGATTGATAGPEDRLGESVDEDAGLESAAAVDDEEGLAGAGGAGARGDEQMLTSSAIAVARKIGRYFRLLQVFRQIAGDVLDAICNLYGSYLWTVWACFVQPNVTDVPAPALSMKSRVLDGLRSSSSDDSGAGSGGGIGIGSGSGSGIGSGGTGGSHVLFCGGGVLGAIGAESGGEVPLPPPEAVPRGGNDSSGGSSSNSGSGGGAGLMFVSPAGALLAADGADQRRLVVEEVPVPERPRGFATPSIYAGADLGTSTNLYGLHHRIVATESLMFLRGAMEHIRPALLAALACAGATGADGAAWRRRAERFYRTAVDGADHVRLLMYRQMAPYLLAVDGPVVAAIEHTRWDAPAAGAGTEHAYVQTVRDELATLAARLDCLRRMGYLPARPALYLWESVCIHVMDVLLEGYGRVRRCSNAGRAAMLMDTQAVADALAAASGGLRPLPGAAPVETFVKAFYLPADDLVALARAHPELTARMLANVFACGLATRLPRKQRNEALAALDAVAHGRPRRPLWHFIPQTLLLEARDAAHKAACAAQLQKMRAAPSSSSSSSSSSS